jgi:hypothetical protein
MFEMSSFSKKKIVICIFPLLGMSLLQLSSAQSGGNYKISKSSIDAGGGKTQGGEYKINSSIGQADASSKISGGEFSLTGGYWSTPNNNDDIIFKNGFE